MIAKIIRRLAESADRQDSQLPESADRPDISHVAESLDRLDDSVVVPSLPTTSDDDNHIRSILGDWELEDNDLASSGFKKRFSGRWSKLKSYRYCHHWASSINLSRLSTVLLSMQSNVCSHMLDLTPKRVWTCM